MRSLWEILVPTTRNNGKPIHTRFHRVWDSKVRAISGGLTIMPVAKGQWYHHEELFSERMIPVRLLATKDEIDQVIDVTLQHYDDQLAVLAYKISDEIILKFRELK